MKLRNLLRPAYLYRRLKVALYEKRHPDHPWIAPGAIRFCEEHLRSDMKALEWGSGRSTLWWARHVDHLVSVEHDPKWHQIISGRLLDQQIKNVDYRFVEVDTHVTGGQRQVFDHLPAYVAVAESFAPCSLDFIVADGHYRQACVRAAFAILKPGGLLLIDNFNWLPDPVWEVPGEWTKVCDATDGLTRTVIFRKPAA